MFPGILQFFQLNAHLNSHCLVRLISKCTNKHIIILHVNKKNMAVCRTPAMTAPRCCIDHSKHLLQVSRYGQVPISIVHDKTIIKDSQLTCTAASLLRKPAVIWVCTCLGILFCNDKFEIWTAPVLSKRPFKI